MGFLTRASTFPNLSAGHRIEECCAGATLFSKKQRYIRSADFCKTTIDPSVADWAHVSKDSCGPRV
ncbi:hypothetical protein L208DRAFT_470842 [Tricholoma matsutake]|nr:hypothetical protein L208DRAFT_470842 [Tricholoma matsutake 945]